MILSTNSVDSHVDNPRSIHETAINTQAEGSPVNSHPRGNSSWVIVVIAVATTLFVCSPFAFLFMVTK